MMHDHEKMPMMTAKKIECGAEMKKMEAMHKKGGKEMAPMRKRMGSEMNTYNK